jgi:threonine dehydratase
VPTPPTAEDVADAARALAGRVVRTPLVESPALAAVAGTDTYIKAELLQRTGSFKVRGALNRVRMLSPEERARGVTTISAGNHAQAVALACAAEGVRATVCMPATASPVKVAATRAHGATVDCEGATVTEALERMHAFADDTGAVVLHPFDDPLVVAGQGTVGAEIADDLDDVGTVVVPVGGGGLISGIALAVAARHPAARIVAVEPRLAATLTAGLAAGEPVAAEPGPTLADALAPPSAGTIAIDVCTRLVEEVVVLDEDELRAGLRFAYAECKLACEAGGAAAIAALVAGRVRARGATVVVASGGNIAPDVLAGVLTT